MKTIAITIIAAAALVLPAALSNNLPTPDLMSHLVRLFETMTK